MKIFKLTFNTFLYIILLTITTMNLYAQAKCGTDEHHRQFLNSDPLFKETFMKQQEDLETIIQKKINEPFDARSQPPQYTIPIVVHIIHLGEPLGTGSNISDQQIYDAIQGLNERWANLIGTGLNMEVDFCLASIDPNGNPTTGINRVDGSSIQSYANLGIESDPDGGCVDNQNEVESLSRWPVLDYYNIWVVHNICSGSAGYAYYPNGQVYDGMVIDDEYMTYSAQTLAHELGHGFNLYHTFNEDDEGNSCPPNTSCMSQGDRICDTPPHKRSDCGTSNPCSGSGVWDNSRFNYMSYSHVCGLTRTRFTADQKTRVQATLEVYPRNQLLNSQGCSGNTGICGLPNTEINYSNLPYTSNGFNLTQSNQDEYDFGPGCVTAHPGPEKVYKITIPPTAQGVTKSVQISVAQLGSTDIFHIIAYKGDCFVPFSKSNGYSGNIGGVPSLSQGLELLGDGNVASTWYVVIDGNATDTYYLRMDGLELNNNCFAEPIACGQSYSGSISQPDNNGHVVYQTNNFPLNSCTGDPHDDFFHRVFYPSQANVYEFIPTVTGYYTIQVQDNQANFVPDLFQLSSCTGNYALKLGSPVAGGAQEISDTYQAGQSYYFAVDPVFVTQGFGNFNAYGNYTLNVQCGPLCFMSAIATPVHAKCGLPNGKVNLAVSDGTGPYTYIWSNGATTKDLVNVGAGTYTVTITDAETCTATASANVQQQNGPTISSLTPTSASCGLSNGGITMNVTGGTGTLSYMWSPGGYTTKNLTNVPAGTYSVTVTDGNGCVSTASKVVESIAGPNISTVTSTNSSCQQTNGKLVIIANGGTGPYMYSTDGINYSSSNTFTGLAAGSYTVYVKDSKGCIDTETASVDSDNAANITTVNSTNAICDQSNGSFTITAVGGTSPYQYSINGINYSSSNTITGLAAGPYTLYVKDANGCISSTTAIISHTEGPEVIIADTANTLTVNITGGTGPFTYQWFWNGIKLSETSQSLSATASGIYTVEVKDAAGCIATVGLSFTLSNKELKAKLKVYPNPTQSKVYIDFETINISDARILILDVSGKQIGTTREVQAENNRINLDMSELIPGSYIVRLITIDNMYSSFIIKQ